MAIQSVSSNAETNQTVDYDKVACDILGGPITGMEAPLAKLRTIESLIVGFATGDFILQEKDLDGLSHILYEIAGEWKKLMDNAYEIYHAANNVA